MATYAGVTFDVIYQKSDYADHMPDFEDEQRVVETPIVGASENDIQFLGFTNRRLIVGILLASVTNLNTLRAARGATLRILSYRGANVSNVLLLQVRAHLLHEDGKVGAEIEVMIGTP